jgi:tripartite-type tricarboxylate transporter receptor subunit TctC
MVHALRLIALALLGAIAAAAAAHGQQDDAKAYPNRAIRIIVPFPPGGPADVIARFVGQRMSEDWGTAPAATPPSGRRRRRARRRTATRCSYRWTRPWS